MSAFKKNKMLKTWRNKNIQIWANFYVSCTGLTHLRGMKTSTKDENLCSHQGTFQFFWISVWYIYITVTLKKKHCISKLQWCSRRRGWIKTSLQRKARLFGPRWRRLITVKSSVHRPQPIRCHCIHFVRKCSFIPSPSLLINFFIFLSKY